MKILLIAEFDQHKMKSATRHTLSAAKELNGSIDLLLIGAPTESVLKEASLFSVDRVLVANHAVYAHQLAENMAVLIAKLGKDYDAILLGATTFGKNLLPRVAALMDIAMIGDVVQIISPDTFVRPTYAGNVLATVQSHDRIKVLSIRTTAYPLHTTNREQPLAIESIAEQIPNALSRFESHELTISERPELTSARVIISGGRGLKSADNFHLLDAIADRLHAAIGASRAAVDAGFAPNDYQVGQTGKVVAPDLYIAVGISGAIQHLAGMKDSKVIVAINNDPDAPIFEVADYGLVGDLFKVLPELLAELDKVRA